MSKSLSSRRKRKIIEDEPLVENTPTPPTSPRLPLKLHVKNEKIRIYGKSEDSLGNTILPFFFCQEQLDRLEALPKKPLRQEELNYKVYPPMIRTRVLYRPYPEGATVPEKREKIYTFLGDDISLNDLWS